MGLFLKRKAGQRITFVLPPSDVERTFEMLIEHISIPSPEEHWKKPVVKCTFDADKEVKIVRNELLSKGGDNGHAHSTNSGTGEREAVHAA